MQDWLIGLLFSIDAVCYYDSLVSVSLEDLQRSSVWPDLWMNTTASLLRLLLNSTVVTRLAIKW